MTTATDTTLCPFELPADVAETRDWYMISRRSTFAPRAALYDEREEMPWPVLQDAAKVGLYTPEFAVQVFTDRPGFLMPVVCEEVYWGDAAWPSVAGDFPAAGGLVRIGHL